MNVAIKVINHNKQRYPTVGDWYYDKQGDLVIKVSKMSDVRYQLLVGIHELIESILCDNNGIDEDEVTKFDIEFEKNRLKGDDREPGDETNAPYHDEHVFATKVEKMLAKKLRIKWKAYEKEVNLLD